MTLTDVAASLKDMTTPAPNSAALEVLDHDEALQAETEQLAIVLSLHGHEGVRLLAASGQGAVFHTEKDTVPRVIKKARGNVSPVLALVAIGVWACACWRVEVWKC